MKAVLALEDGTLFEGESFGAPGEGYGEIVFNTSMTGYQEILTDPSYKGQMVVMTYPMIGNYGVNRDDVESPKPQVEGFIVREYCPFPSNPRSKGSLGAYLEENNIVAIEGVDTRALTLRIRSRGTMRGVISTVDFKEDSLTEKARRSPKLEGRDLVGKVTTAQPYEWDACSGTGPLIVVYDFGVKHNILRMLSSLGCRVTVVPASTEPQRALELEPGAILLSNGPGDPSAVEYAIENTRQLMGEKPLMGICLGHQILALALGGSTYKLKFGHHGGNHPVKDLKTGRVEITVQNHSFAVDRGSVPDECEVTHLNLNDQTVEGLRHRSLPISSVQYHPEASPGPQDANHLLAKFVDMVRESK